MLQLGRISILSLLPNVHSREENTWRRRGRRTRSSSDSVYHQIKGWSARARAWWFLSLYFNLVPLFLEMRMNGEERRKENKLVSGKRRESCPWCSRGIVYYLSFLFSSVGLRRRMERKKERREEINDEWELLTEKMFCSMIQFSSEKWRKRKVNTNLPFFPRISPSVSVIATVLLFRSFFPFSSSKTPLLELMSYSCSRIEEESKVWAGSSHGKRKVESSKKLSGSRRMF